MENFKYKNKSFIMPMSAFDPFMPSWFVCSSCEIHCLRNKLRVKYLTYVLIVEFILRILFAMNKHLIFSTNRQNS